MTLSPDFILIPNHLINMHGMVWELLPKMMSLVERQQHWPDCQRVQNGSELDENVGVMEAEGRDL